MKIIKHSIAALVYLVLVAAYCICEGKLGLYGLPAILILAILYLVFAITAAVHLVKIFFEKFKNKSRIVGTSIIIAVLTGIAVIPFGSAVLTTRNTYLFASREGSANCTCNLYLYKDSSFLYREICFGVTDYESTYRISNDTFFFKENNCSREKFEYKFATMKKNTSPTDQLSASLRLWKGNTDTVGMWLQVSKFWF